MIINQYWYAINIKTSCQIDNHAFVFKQYFVCKLCLTCSKEEVDIKDHVKAIHGKVSDKDPEFNEAAEECVSDEDQRIEIEELGVKAFRSKAKQMLTNNSSHKSMYTCVIRVEKVLMVIFCSQAPIFGASHQGAEQLAGLSTSVSVDVRLVSIYTIIFLNLKHFFKIISVAEATTQI